MILKNKRSIGMQLLPIIASLYHKNLISVSTRTFCVITIKDFMRTGESMTIVEMCDSLLIPVGEKEKIFKLIREE